MIWFLKLLTFIKFIFLDNGTNFWQVKTKRWGGPMTPWGVCWEAPGRFTSLPRRSISALAASTPQTVTHTCRNITELTRGKNRSAVLVVPTSPPPGETWESISVFTLERSRFPALSVCTAQLTAVTSRSTCGPMTGSSLCLLSHQTEKMWTRSAKEDCSDAPQSEPSWPDTKLIHFTFCLMANFNFHPFILMKLFD